MRALNCFELPRGERVTNEWSCPPPPPLQHWSGAWPFVNLPSPPSHDHSSTCAVCMTNETKDAVRLGCTCMYAPAECISKPPMSPALLLVISPAWLMRSCKYRGGKIPLLASKIQTALQKGIKLLYRCHIWTNRSSSSSQMHSGLSTCKNVSVMLGKQKK